MMSNKYSYVNLLKLCILIISCFLFTACGKSPEQRMQSLINGMGRRGSPNSREACMERLVKQGDVAIGPLIKAFETRKDHYVRMYAATALAEIGASRAIEPIHAAMFNDTHKEVRGSAILAYTKLKGEAAIPELVKILRNDKDVIPARQAFAVLGQPAVDDLIFLLEDPDALFRSEIREALSLIGSAAVPELISALGKDNDILIVELFRTLADICDPAAIPAMKITLQRYPAWQDPLFKKHKKKLYKILEGYYNDLRMK